MFVNFKEFDLNGKKSVLTYKELFQQYWSECSDGDYLWNLANGKGLPFEIINGDEDKVIYEFYTKDGRYFREMDVYTTFYISNKFANELMKCTNEIIAENEYGYFWLLTDNLDYEKDVITFYHDRKEN